MAYADDITITFTHTSTSAANKYILPYLHNVFAWTKQNNLTLNPDKRTCTLFTPDPAEYKSNLDLKNKQHCTTHGNAPKGYVHYLRPKTHIQHMRSDDLQFSYKKSCSTIQCVSMVTEVVNYHRNNGSSVYMCMLDAPKAFDGVNLLTLFKTLYSRGMCLIYLRLLMKIYEEQNMRIRWKNTVTDYFTISNGVKQGGVLSPILFSLYLDQLISRLSHIGMGCHMNGLFTGVFIYADDITLLAPSRASQALMLEQCERFSRTHTILFNASITKIWFSSVVR